MNKTEKPRVFISGASRDTDNGKLDFEGFYSPLVMEKFGEYMNKNRTMKDGSIRDSDNWQKGIPVSVYMKSLWRHFFYTWKAYRAGKSDEAQIENLCAIMFNTQGMLHELLATKPAPKPPKPRNSSLFSKLERASKASSVNPHRRD